MVKLEPVLDWSALRAGASFAPARCTLDDAFVDAYLHATGENHALYAQGWAPPLSLLLVRFTKASLGGRWPSGTLQLTQSFRSFRALRRGERITLDLHITSIDQQEGRLTFATRSVARDEQGHTVAEQGSSQNWTRPGSRRATGNVPAPSNAPLSPVWSAQNIGPLTECFPMARLRAYGEVAGALDPIHLDPEFARSTNLGVNIAQGKLVMTMLHRLMLDCFEMPWLERGILNIRFRRPVLVDQPIEAWARPLEGTDGSAFEVWCSNPCGERLIVGKAGLPV